MQTIIRSTASETNCSAVEVAGLTVVYGRSPVLSDVDLKITRGETTLVTGPNGAGKSTLLGCLAGALQPVVGTVNWFGDASTPSRQVRSQIGFVGQELGVYAELTVTENLLFAGRMYGVIDVGRRVADLIDAGQLQLQAHRPVGHLSQGMKQRVAILRALVHQPQLIVLDEPTAKLDVDGFDWLERLVEQHRSAGRAVCLASHDDRCRAWADRIVCFEAGRVVAIHAGNRSTNNLQRSA